MILNFFKVETIYLSVAAFVKPLRIRSVMQWFGKTFAT
jgi:hypothetical protein